MVNVEGVRSEMDERIEPDRLAEATGIGPVIVRRTARSTPDRGGRAGVRGLAACPGTVRPAAVCGLCARGGASLARDRTLAEERRASLVAVDRSDVCCGPGTLVEAPSATA